MNNINFMLKRKKEGFTLIELLAVISIILVLAGLLFPKLAGYVNSAKKLKVVDQCRKVVIAAESYGLRNTSINDSDSVSMILKKEDIDDYVDEDDLKNINISDTTLKQCYNIVEGAEFDLIETNGKMMLDSKSIHFSNAVNKDISEEK